MITHINDAHMCHLASTSKGMGGIRIQMKYVRLMILIDENYSKAVVQIYIFGILYYAQIQIFHMPHNNIFWLIEFYEDYVYGIWK